MVLSLKKIRLGYALSSLLLLISYALILFTNRRLQQEQDWIISNYMLINKIRDIKMALGEAELNTQAYIINKSPHLLNDFYNNRSNIKVLYTGMKKLAAADAVQMINAEQLILMTDRRLAELSPIFTLNRNAANPANQLLTDSINAQVLKMTKQGQSGMSKRMVKLDDFYASTEAMTILSLFMTLIAALYAIITFNSQYRQKKKANTIAELYRSELESNVKELSEKNTELNELKGVEKLATIGRVSRMVAHEVRNPLTNITLAAAQLRDIPGLEKDPEAELLISLINRNSARISQMVTDLLNATKFMQLDKQDLDINQLLDESLLMAKDRLLLRKIRVIKKYAKDIGGVMADKDRITMAFLNIIVNAIEAMDEGTGILELTTRVEDGKCIIEIKDNGSGMDEHTLQNLFEPYFTSKNKGNGLGLTHAQNVILNHKGSIKVNSEKDKGSVFIITLNSTQ